MTVPHTRNVMPDYASYDGLGRYRRSFRLRPDGRDAHLRLRFEVVFYVAHVWLNGAYLGRHKGGYAPFELGVSRLQTM